jgi:hypothetical protein
MLSRCFKIMPITLIQHDIATSHTATGTVNFLRVNNIEFINDWLAKSPDINPIERLCDYLDQRVRRRAFPLSYFIQLRWYNIPQTEINALIRSLHQRCQAVLHAEDGHTRYKFVTFDVGGPLLHCSYHYKSKALFRADFNQIGSTLSNIFFQKHL